jgi:hypothetical protein
MKQWRHAVVESLLAALDRGLISSVRPRRQLRALIERHRDAWWKAGIRECRSVHALVGYMSRYLRRPPIAQSRLLSYDGERVRFRYKDTETKQWGVEECSADEFIRRWSDHIPGLYLHGMNYFGLLAPRSKGREFEVFWALLKQKRRSRPRRIPWRKLFWLTFKRDPLLAMNGEVMQKIRRVLPERPKATTDPILRQ